MANIEVPDWLNCSMNYLIDHIDIDQLIDLHGHIGKVIRKRQEKGIPKAERKLLRKLRYKIRQGKAKSLEEAYRMYSEHIHDDKCNCLMNIYYRVKLVDIKFGDEFPCEDFEGGECAELTAIQNSYPEENYENYKHEVYRLLLTPYNFCKSCAEDRDQSRLIDFKKYEKKIRKYEERKIRQHENEIAKHEEKISVSKKIIGN